MNAQTIFILAMSGFLGGIVLALVGIIKNQQLYQDDFHFDGKRVAVTILASGLIGLAAGMLITEGDFRLALLAGYAGTDLLESIFKIRSNQGTMSQ